MIGHRGGVGCRYRSLCEHTEVPRLCSLTLIEDEATLSPKWAAGAHFGACVGLKCPADLPHERRGLPERCPRGRLIGMTKPMIGTGVWSSALRNGDPHEIAPAAGELESLGYSAMWIPDVGGDVFGAVENLLAATTTATIATAVLNLWMHTEEKLREPRDADRSNTAIDSLSGGVSHTLLIDARSRRAPIVSHGHMRAFLDALDAAPVPLAVEDRALAALGPKMLELAATRLQGSTPTCDTGAPHLPRRRSGRMRSSPPNRVWCWRPTRSSSKIARANLANYFLLPNYTNTGSSRVHRR